MGECGGFGEETRTEGGEEGDVRGVGEEVALFGGV